MFVWSFSDSHLGMPSCYDAFHNFLNTVETDKPDLLIGVGDIVELIWCTFYDCMDQIAPRDAIDHLKYVALNIHTILLPGNHDLDLWTYGRDLAPLVLLPGRSSYSCDGVLYIHGHQFDPVYQSTWKWITRLPLADKVAPCISRKLYGTPYEKKAQGWDESYRKLAGLIETMTLLHGAEKIVYGHTHSEHIRYTRHGWSANCGDFTDSASALKVVDGVPSMVWFK